MLKIALTRLVCASLIHLRSTSSAGIVIQKALCAFTQKKLYILRKQITLTCL